MLLGATIYPMSVDASLPDDSVKAMVFPTEFTQDRDYLVVYFYPADFTSICPTEVLAFHAQMQEFAELNTAIAAVSCNTRIRARNTHKSPDNCGPDRVLAKLFDVLIPGRNLACRGLFILSKFGEVLFESRHDTKTARSVTEVISIVRDVIKVDNATGKRIRVESI